MAPAAVACVDFLEAGARGAALQNKREVARYRLWILRRGQKGLQTIGIDEGEFMFKRDIEHLDLRKDLPLWW